MNTIFAHCSGAGKSGIAVFRISGSDSITALQQLIADNTDKMQPRKMYLRKLYHPSSREIIDDAMVVFFNHGSSFTGEDSVEIHVHGSIAVMKKLNAALMSIDGLRLAEPGEFARRAFLNGKLDLTAAEGLADLIDAETDMQHKQAIMQLGGGLLRLYDNWREQLLKLMGLIEAYIDFPDEEIPEETLVQINDLIENLINTINIHLADNRAGERLRSGIKLAIIGKPNAGKSSLLNYLMQREISIVSNIAGTTRDVIEGHLDIGGYPIIIQDTAGINDITSDEIEKEGIRRARATAKEADIKIIMFDASVSSDYSFFDDPIDDMIDDNTIILLNKIDLISKSVLDSLLLNLRKKHKGRITAISLKENQALGSILAEIESMAEKLAGRAEAPQITRARHRVQLEQAAEALGAVDFDNDLVLAAEDIRMTIRALGNITGRITVDEILGEIFSNFCIGK